MRFSIFFIFAILFFASCGTRRNATIQDRATFDEGVVINGIRWATRNVDAPGTFAESPESFGMFFQWNRRKGWSAVDEEVEGWDSSTPTGTEWYAENDPCPEGWRVPTSAELFSLLRSGSIWTDKNGVRGLLFGTIPKQIFLPGAGHRRYNSIYGHNLGYYWSSSRDYFGRVYALLFLTNGRIVFYFDRQFGSSIRCVAK